MLHYNQTKHTLHIYTLNLFTSGQGNSPFLAHKLQIGHATEHLGCTFNHSQKYLQHPQVQAKQQLKKSSGTWESSAGKLGDLQNQIKSSGVGGGGRGRM